MTALARIQQITGSFLRYGAVAAAAVAQVQAEVGPSNGDAGLQQNKRQLAIMYVLAAAHAGETVPFPLVQEISMVVDLSATLSKGLGLFGKVAAPVSVSVPAAPVAQAVGKVAPVAPGPVAVGAKA